ncbi:MAG: hypothetical protein HYX34_01715 [Actinobacteria bacterium]|nr:hypothetical protein [Actinomycetota bacterium]
MEIVAAVYVDTMDFRQTPGPSTRIDLTGVHFSAPADAPAPVTVTPHLLVLVWCPPDGKGTGALEVVFERASGAGPADPADTADAAGPGPGAGEGDEPEVVARNVQPLQVEPGRFNYRLVRAELDFPTYGTVLARCRVDLGPVTTAPFTLLPPVP